MSREDDEKGLATEALPAPEPAVRASPRQRTRDHLARIVAAAGLALAPTGAAADSTVPPTGKSNTSDGKGTKTAKGGKKKPPTRPEPQPGYFVVDPVPSPPDLPEPPPPQKPPAPTGVLNLSSLPFASIRVDGVDTGLKTPQPQLRLAEGVHTISLLDPTGFPLHTFTVTIVAGTTIKEVHDMRKKTLRPTK